MRSESRGAAFTMVGALVCAASLSMSIAAAPTSQPAKAINPHGSPTGCKECHTYTGDRPQPIDRDRIDALCRKCHNGKQASREVHPVGRLFVGDQVRCPQGWPAPGNKLSCGTCHDIRSACEGVRPKANKAFLRAVAGVQSGGDRMAFCVACHVAAAREKGGRYNPHIMLDDKGQPVGQACGFCHQTSLKYDGRLSENQPDTFLGRANRTGDAKLRGDPIAMCAICHPRHVEWFEPGHIGLPLPAAMKARLVAGVSTRPAATSLPAQTQPAGSASVRLPLGAGDRIVCSTCHNPHQEGLFPPGSELGEGGLRWGPNRQRLPFRGPGKDLCRVCHEMSK